MSFELYVALRYLLARRKQAFISLISFISILGVGVGVMAVLIAMALMTGLQKELRDRDAAAGVARRLGLEVQPAWGAGKIATEIFERLNQDSLIQPTFVYDFPTEVSPLSKQRADDPDTVERFELYIGGFEVANAFSELNDPAEQRRRFEAQLKDKAAGDLEAHAMDEDYIRALEYGMPPAAGEGIGNGAVRRAHDFIQRALSPALPARSGARGRCAAARA